MPLDPATGAALAAGAADFVGGLFTNRSSAKEAERNRRFAKEMSSTAVQRSVRDYQLAGLNPALAYDRPASSPGGTQASFENPVSRAVSSAMSVANLRLLKAQAAKVESEKALIDTDVSMRTATTGDEPTWRDEQIAKRVATLRDIAHQGRLQPHDERLRELAVQMQKLMTARPEFFAETFEDVDKVRDFIRKGLSSAGDAAEAFKAWVRADQAIQRERQYRRDTGGMRKRSPFQPPRRDQ